MDDVKKTYREGEQATKEVWRKSDGDESLADKVGNVGDEVRKDLGNAGDDMTGTSGKSVADKVGSAGDEIRRDTTDRL